MARNTSIILGALLILVGCAPPVGESTITPTGTPAGSTEPTDPVDLEIVRAFFDSLGESLYTINPNHRTFGEKQSHVFRWVVAAISESQHDEIQGYATVFL